MALPASPNAISLLDIRGEFYGKIVNVTNYGTSNTNLNMLSYYRSKHYYTAAGVLSTFPATTIAFSDFHGKQWNDPTPPPPPPPGPPGGCP